MQCTGTLADGNASCTVDTVNGKPIDQARKDGDISKGLASQITQIEKGLTEAYKAALKNGSETFEITVPGKDSGSESRTLQFTGKDLATVLSDHLANVVTDRPPANPAALAESRGANTDFFANALRGRSVKGLAAVSLHGAIHQKHKVSFMNYVYGKQGWPKNHNEFFDPVLKKMLGGDASGRYK